MSGPSNRLDSSSPSPTAAAPVLVLSNSANRMDQAGRNKYVKQVTGRQNGTGLHLAAQRGDLEAVRQIIAEIDAQMTGTGEEFDSEVAEIRAAIVNEANEMEATALFIAAEKGFLDIVVELLKHSDKGSLTRKNKSGFDALHVAARQGHRDIVKVLLDHDPTLGKTFGQSNVTPLITAVIRGHTAVVNLLLERVPGLIESSKTNGKNALHFAARQGHVEIVKALLDADTQLARRTDKKGQTALHMAVKGTSPEVVQALVNADPAIVMLPDRNGNLALHVATRKKRSEIVNVLLLLPDMNVNALTWDRKTAFDIAEGLPLSEESQEIKECLSRAGAVRGLRANDLNQPRDELRRTVTEIKKDVHSQLEQARATNKNVYDIAKELRKLHSEDQVRVCTVQDVTPLDDGSSWRNYVRAEEHSRRQVPKVAEPHYTPYEDAMAWLTMGKQRKKGRNHTFMQAGHKLLGRDEIRQNIMEKVLLDRDDGSNCTVFCINGESGFGKTSLLSALYNDEELLHAFDKRIWIRMSDKLDVLMLFRKIIEFVMNGHCSIMSTDLLQELLMEEITDEKFLLILDDADIEDQQFWNSILEVLNAGAKGSAIIMATKSCAVATPRDVTYFHLLNPLSEENKLMIFQYAGLGIDIQSNPDLMMIANGIISRFGYNLLHLKAICGLLCHTDALSVQEDKFEGSVMPLRLCHDVLPVHLKRCLALCSLFPEGYIFDKHHVALLWISHGCVTPVEGYELEDVGVEYFNELLYRSFFQCSPVHSDKDDMFVMHELMYNVVVSVSGDKYFKFEDPINIPENVLHCSLISSQFQTVELMHRTEQLKDLQTFLALQPEWKPNNSLPTLNLVGLDDFFLKFTSLETLDLSHTETEALPGSIAGLRNLRYLSVNNTNVRALPSELCSLSNLQTLEAKHCRFLTELPRDVRTLVKLRHLDLMKELGYVDLPSGIGGLTELQTLPVLHVSEEPSRCSISELGSLHNLRGCLWLSGLGSVKTISKAHEANLKDKRRLNDLTLQWHDDGMNIEDEDEDEDTETVAHEQVLEGLQPHVNLQVLTIRGYEGSRFPAWMQDSSPALPNLVTLTLDSCCNCTEFPAIAHLPSLKSLSVRKMYDVQRLSSNRNTDGLVRFPSLELLNLWEMYGLEELFSKESEGDCPRLHKVCISRCPDLKRLPHTPLTELVLHCGHQVPDISELTSLVSLKIEGFHGTKSFGLPAAALLRKLEIRSCKELSSVDGLSSALMTTVQRIKITGCPKLVLPERRNQ